MAGVDTWTIPADWTTLTTISKTKLEQQIRDNETVLRNVAEGDVSGEWNLESKRGTLGSKPTPGAAVGVRRYYATDLGLELIDDGTEWLAGASYPQKCEYFGDDLLANPVEGNGTDTGRWKATVADGGTTGGAASGTDGGGQILKTGTDPNGHARLSLRQSRFYIDPAAIGLYIIDVATLIGGTGHVQFAGLYSANSKTPADAIYVRRDGSANWFAITRSGGTDQTSTDLSITGTTRFLIICELLNTSVKWYLNTYNAAGFQAEHNTALPTADMDFGFFAQNDSGGVLDRQLLCHKGHLWTARP